MVRVGLFWKPKVSDDVLLARNQVRNVPHVEDERNRNADERMFRILERQSLVSVRSRCSRDRTVRAEHPDEILPLHEECCVHDVPNLNQLLQHGTEERVLFAECLKVGDSTKVEVALRLHGNVERDLLERKNRWHG